MVGSHLDSIVPTDSLPDGLDLSQRPTLTRGGLRWQLGTNWGFSSKLNRWRLTFPRHVFIRQLSRLARSYPRPASLWCRRWLNNIPNILPFELSHRLFCVFLQTFRRAVVFINAVCHHVQHLFPSPIGELALERVDHLTIRALGQIVAGLHAAPGRLIQ